MTAFEFLYRMLLIGLPMDPPLVGIQPGEEVITAIHSSDDSSSSEHRPRYTADGKTFYQMSGGRLGDMRAVTDGSNRVQSLEFLPSDSLHSKAYTVFDYHYSAKGQVDTLRAFDSTGVTYVTAWFRDGQGRVDSIHERYWSQDSGRWLDNRSRLLYDAQGCMVESRNSDSPDRVLYTYDGEGRPRSREWTRSTLNFTDSITYDSRGRWTGMQYWRNGRWRQGFRFEYGPLPLVSVSPRAPRISSARGRTRFDVLGRRRSVNAVFSTPTPWR